MQAGSRQKLLLALLVCAVGVIGFAMYVGEQSRPSSAVASTGGAASTSGVLESDVDAKLGPSVRVPEAPAQIAKGVVAATVAERIREGLNGDPDVSWTYFNAGLNSDQLSDLTLIAQQIGTICETAVTRNLRPELPSISASTQIALVEARARLEVACQKFYSIRLEDLRRFNSQLLQRIEGENSAFGRGYVDFSGVREEAGNQEARRRLRQSIEEYGASSLFWSSPSLAAWLAQRDRANGVVMSSLPTHGMYDSISVIAMCLGGGPCGGQSLTYLNLCANLGNCDGGVVAGVLSRVPIGDREYVLSRAREVAAQVGSRDFKALGL